MSLQKCFNSSFGCNSVSAVVSGSYCRCLRKPFAVKAAMESTEGRPSAGGRADRECVYSYPSRTLPNYVLSSGAVPNYDKPMFVVNQLALMEVGISTLVIHTSTKLAAPCLGSFSNSWTWAGRLYLVSVSIPMASILETSEVAFARFYNV